MNIRLEQFMRAEQLTAAKLAEILQIQPSSISHLLSGRNKPSFEFISRIMKMFPELNPDWLVNGEGAMHRAKMINVTIEGVADTMSDKSSDNMSNIFDNEINTSVNNVNHSITPKSTLFNLDDKKNSSLDGTENASIVSHPNSDNQRVNLIHEVSDVPIETPVVSNFNEKIEVNHNSTNNIVSCADSASDSGDRRDRDDVNIVAQNQNIVKVLVMYEDKTFEIFNHRS